LYHATTSLMTGISRSKQPCMDRSAAAAHHKSTTRAEKKEAVMTGIRGKKQACFRKQLLAPMSCMLFQHQHKSEQPQSGPSMIHPSITMLPKRCYNGKGSLKGVLTPQSFTPFSHHCNAKKGVHEHIRTAQRMDGSPQGDDDWGFGIIAANPVH